MDNQDSLGYTKELEIRLIRTKHKIRFATGTTVENIENMLQSVPENSEVDEIIYDEDKPNLISIIFHEEKVSKES